MEEVAEAPRSIPTSLKVVAWIYLFQGVCSLVAMVVGWILGHGTIDLGVINLLIGWGLLDLKAGWRSCALIFLWITLIVAPLGAVLLLIASHPATFKIFGVPVGILSTDVMGAFLALVFFLALWQYRVLTRPDVRALFE